MSLRFFFCFFLPNFCFNFEFVLMFLLVAPEAASAVAAQAVDDPPSGRFTWTIEGFSRLNTKKLYSDTFFVGGYKW